MSIFDGMDGDLGAELDDLGIDNDFDTDAFDGDGLGDALGDGLDADLGDLTAADVPGAAISLPDPFGGGSLSPQTQGVLDSTDALMADASATYTQVAAAEGLAPDLPAPGADQADTFIDAAMNADAEQAARMAGFEQGETYVQDVANDIADRQAEVQQGEDTSEALADAEYLAWEADRAGVAAERAVTESQAERGAP